jgi:ribosomal protein S18 acetylase RimI-like enzyme
MPRRVGPCEEGSDCRRTVRDMQTREPHIVRARLAHHAQALEILSEYLRTVDEYAGPEQTNAELESLLPVRAGGFWLAVSGAEPLACIELRALQADACEIKRLYVRPQARGRGIARTLIRAVEAFAREKGARQIFLDTKSTMAAAIALYEREGFVRVPPYHETPHADVFMRKTLS